MYTYIDNNTHQEFLKLISVSYPNENPQDVVDRLTEASKIDEYSLQVYFENLHLWIKKEMFIRDDEVVLSEHNKWYMFSNILVIPPSMQKNMFIVKYPKEKKKCFFGLFTTSTEIKTETLSYKELTEKMRSSSSMIMAINAKKGD